MYNLAEIAKAGAAGVAVLVIYVAWRAISKITHKEPGPIYALLGAGVVMTLILFWPSIYPQRDIQGEIYELDSTLQSIMNLDSSLRNATANATNARDNRSDARGCSEAARLAQSDLYQLARYSSEVKSKINQTKENLARMASRGIR